jgi:hypothetical protein
MVYEPRTHALLPWPAFVRRAGAHFAIGVGLLLVSAGLGTLGYHFVGGLAWLDAFLNASMILTGMGPVDRMEQDPGKWFAALYALYSGVVFLAVMGILIAPWAHRLLHHFHLEEPAE